MPLENLNKRRGRRILKEDTSKSASQLWREYIRVDKARRELGLIELEEPYKRGYDRFFVLSELTLKDPNAPLFEKILEKHLQNKEWGRNKSFSFRNYKTRKLEPRQHILKEIEVKTIYDIPEKMLGYFAIEWKEFTNGRGKWIYRFKFPKMFRSKIVPHIVTHLPMLDETLESRYQELHNKIFSDDYQWQKIANALDFRSGYRNSYDDLKYTDPAWVRFRDSEKG